MARLLSSARILVLFGVCLCFVTAVQVNAADWPAFRGVHGDGIATDDEFPVEWSGEKNVKWKIALGGNGNGSPIVSHGKVFVTYATDEGSKRHLFCCDRATGEVLWDQAVEFEKGEVTHQTNPYAGSTPVADGERVVVYHGNAGVFCYDYAGNELWSQQIPHLLHIWGYGTSPVLHDGRVIINVGAGVEAAMVSLNLEDGSIVWQTPEPGGTNDTNGRLVGSWSTPILVEVDGQTQILCSMPTRVVAYQPDDGAILWSVSGMTSERGDLCYASPIVKGEYGVAMGGYKGPAFGFKLGGTGDVTESNRLWHNVDNQPQRIGSGVIVGDFLFVANAGPGTAECLEPLTGKEVWIERLEGDHWGSLVLAGGRLYATNQSGTTTVFLPNPDKFESVSTNELGEPTNATPAFSDGEIFIRTASSLFSISEQ
ncbi:MAG: PQQ-binding-like beta-propeller repeat protein [Planctomycetota bacterium]|nr:PQQ-binding-like beta-propeller repeat protein [Planctomycetota bacterium]MDA1211661.1 PQQ-binding-like beta-propeller repeat protein [Planctomycetota bacterium]